MLSAVVLSGTTSPSSTAIIITGSVPSDTVVTGFEIRWQRDTSVGCSDEDEDTIFETGTFPNIYQISGLEPGNRYTITVTVSNAAGTAPASNSVTGTTLETGERECECVIIVDNRDYVNRDWNRSYHHFWNAITPCYGTRFCHEY